MGYFLDYELFTTCWYCGSTSCSGCRIREVTAMSEENDAVAHIVDRALTVPRQGTPISACPTNLDTRTMLGKSLMLKAAGPGELAIPEDGPLRMRATHWVLIPDTHEDEKTGEVKEFVRTVFFNAERQHFRTTSAHSPLRLCAMLELFTADEWADGIPLIIQCKKSKRGTIYHDIQIDMEDRLYV